MQVGHQLPEKMCAEMYWRSSLSLSWTVPSFSLDPVCWGGSISASDPSRLNKLIKKAGSFIGCSQCHGGEEDDEGTELTGQQTVFTKRMTKQRVIKITSEDLK